MTWRVPILLLSLMLIAGCGYGDVSSTSYEYAKSLYSISNRKLSDRLPGVRAQVAESRETGDITGKEADWLEAIIETAEDKHWQKAMKSARRIMEDQVSH